MDRQILVISNPPHPRHEDDIDLERVAQVLGLDIYLARLKVRFSAPEIFFWTSPEEAAKQARALRDAGLSISAQSGVEMADPPWPDPARTLSLDESGLRATTGERSLLVRSRDCSCFHSEIFAACPVSRISGTFHPRYSAGLV